MSTKIVDELELFEAIDGNVQRLQKEIQNLAIIRKMMREQQAVERSFFVGSAEDSEILKFRHAEELREFDIQMLTFLWRCRKFLSTTKIASLLGLSRQALYQRWARYDYVHNEEK